MTNRHDPAGLAAAQTKIDAAHNSLPYDQRPGTYTIPADSVSGSSYKGWSASNIFLSVGNGVNGTVAGSTITSEGGVISYLGAGTPGKSISIGSSFDGNAADFSKDLSLTANFIPIPGTDNKLWLGGGVSINRHDSWNPQGWDLEKSPWALTASNGFGLSLTYGYDKSDVSSSMQSTVKYVQQLNPRSVVNSMVDAHFNGVSSIKYDALGNPVP